MGLFSKPIHTLDDLFVHTLQDIYYAENQIVKNLPTMVQKAISRKRASRCSDWNKCSRCTGWSRRQ